MSENASLGQGVLRLLCKGWWCCDSSLPGRDPVQPRRGFGVGADLHMWETWARHTESFTP